MLFARIMALANGKKMKYNITRCGKISVFYIILLLINIVGVGLIYYKLSGGTMSINNLQSTQKVFALSSGLFILLNIIAIPVSYVSYKYIFEAGNKLHKIFFKGYIMFRFFLHGFLLFPSFHTSHQSILISACPNLFTRWRI